ncbi:MAG: hypothetical protein K8S25_13065, partial [Alphaproteobacteria bacterium]|nr:hypothetical protein [Alphaproteobacteria bacterium]
SVGASAHGYAGSRFFPATILIEDPFVADELALPTYTHRKGGDEPGVTEDEFEFEFAKRITSTFALSIEGGWSREHGEEGDVDGFGNLEVGAKYQILKIDDDEFVLSAGLGVELGGTGSQRLEVEGFNTYTPAVYFGKGLGSLPKSVDLLRPFAVTGFAGIAIPGRGKTLVETIDPDTLDPIIEEERHVSHLVYGAAIEYSLPYLHANVRDVGLPEWLNQVTPLVEVSLSTPVEGNDGERTTGTINPGLIWAGQSVQLAAEAVIPINRDSGDSVGFALQLHFYLDDLFPDSIGKPVFAD